MFEKRFEHNKVEVTGTRVELKDRDKVMYREEKNEAGISIGKVELKDRDLYMAQCDVLLRAFKKKVINSGKLDDYRRHEAFLPKGLRRKEKQKRAKIRRVLLNKKHNKKY